MCEHTTMGFITHLLKAVLLDAGPCEQLWVRLTHNGIPKPYGLLEGG
jgi:hypothetical protein